MKNNQLLGLIAVAAAVYFLTRNNIGDNSIEVSEPTSVQPDPIVLQEFSAINPNLAGPQRRYVRETNPIT